MPYQGQLDVPTEPGRLPDSQKSSLLEPGEDDGSRGPREGVTANALTTTPAGTSIEDEELRGHTEREGITANAPTTTPAGTSTEDKGPRGRTERPRYFAKPTMRATEYVYF